jgi:putative endonuclease
MASKGKESGRCRTATHTAMNTSAHLTRVNAPDYARVRMMRCENLAPHRFDVMGVARHVLGERGERVAERWLVSNGWSIVDRRFRSGHRDIDLVAELAGDGPGRVVAFVEVKTRVSNAFGGPLGAVHWRKQREMARAARDWMRRFHRPGDVYRFDVVGVVFGGTEPEVVHIENAFAVR